MIRGKHFSIVAVGFVLVLCLTMGLFMVFSDANRNSNVNYDIKTVTDNSLAMPTSSNSGVSTDLNDGDVVGGSADYINKVYGSNTQVVRISTAQQLRDWLWYDANQKSAILVNDIVDFNWADEAGWAGSYVAPHLTKANGKTTSINEGVILDGCGFEVKFNSTNGQDIRFNLPATGAFDNVLSVSYSFFASTVSGTVRNLSFDFPVNIDMKIPYNGLNGQENLVAGLVFADILSTGVVENVNVNHDATFSIHNSAQDGGFWIRLHTGLLTGRTSGKITQTTINVGAKSNMITRAFSSRNYESYAYSGYIAGRVQEQSITTNVTINTDDKSKVHLESGGADHTSFGMVAGRSHGGNINGFIYNGKTDIRANYSKAASISIVIGYAEGDRIEISNIVSAVGKIKSGRNDAVIVGYIAAQYSYMHTNTTKNRGFDIKFDKLSYNNGMLNNYILTKKTSYEKGFIWSVDFARGSNIVPYFTYEQYSASIVTVPMINAIDAQGVNINSGQNYEMSLSEGQIGENVTYGWESSAYEYDGTTHDMVLNVPDNWDLYDDTGAVKPNVSVDFKNESVTDVQHNVGATLMPVATVYHSGEGIVYLDKNNKRMILSNNAKIGNKLRSVTSVYPAVIVLEDDLFDTAFRPKEYDGFKLIDKSLFNKIEVASGNKTIELDILAADKYLKYNDNLNKVNVDYVIGGELQYSGYLSTEAGSTEGVIMINAAKNYVYQGADNQVIEVVDDIVKIYTTLPPIAPLQVSVAWDDLGEISYSGLTYEPQASFNISTYINKYATRPSCTVTYEKDGVAHGSLRDVGEYVATATLDNDNYVVKTDDTKHIYKIAAPIVNLILSNGVVNMSYSNGMWTLVPVPEQSYIFSHWENAYGLLLSEQRKLEVYVSVSDTFKPVFVADPEYKVTVKFLSDNGTLIMKEIVASETVFGDIRPSDPIKPGFTFMGWFNKDNIITDVNYLTTDWTLTAKYERNEDPLISTVTLKDIDGITYNINNEVVEGSKGYNNDTLLSISFSDTAKNFLYWASATNKILSYDRTYMFYAHNSISMHPVFDTDYQVSTTPISSIDAQVVFVGNLNASINGSFVVVEGETVLEHGMLVGTSNELDVDDMVITNTSISKNSLTLYNQFNQFRTLHNADAYGKHKIRAYMILQTATGDTKVVYSSIIDVNYTASQKSTGFVTGASDIEIFGSIK